MMELYAKLSTYLASTLLTAMLFESTRLSKLKLQWFHSKVTVTSQSEIFTVSSNSSGVPVAAIKPDGLKAFKSKSISIRLRTFETVVKLQFVVGSIVQAKTANATCTGQPALNKRRVQLPAQPIQPVERPKQVGLRLVYSHRLAQQHPVIPHPSPRSQSPKATKSHTYNALICILIILRCCPGADPPAPLPPIVCTQLPKEARPLSQHLTCRICEKRIADTNVRARACMHACTNVCARTCMDADTNVCARTCMHAHISAPCSDQAGQRCVDSDFA
jgi:hypothetical protein